MAIVSLNSMVTELARTDIPILIVGESGTGKDVYARLVHYLSVRRSSPFQKMNCAAIKPGDLVSSANEALPVSLDPGAIPSVYLDNIQELDLPRQRFLLSQISDAESTGSRYASGARLISSSTRNLEPEVSSGRFLHELYFRLNGASLHLPPLRERAEDIPILVDCFLRKHAEIMRRAVPSLNDKAIKVMMDYHWPGNIRELESLVRRIVVFGDFQMAMEELKGLQAAGMAPVSFAKSTPLKAAARAASKETERQLIMQALERTRWNRKRAARELKISYKALLYKIKQIGLSSENSEV